jgi:hypothetical protein
MACPSFYFYKLNQWRVDFFIFINRHDFTLMFEIVCDGSLWVVARK